jgi:hypothetical protein
MSLARSEMQKKSYASVKKSIPKTMMAVKYYHCVLAPSSVN